MALWLFLLLTHRSDLKCASQLRLKFAFVRRMCAPHLQTNPKSSSSHLTTQSPKFVMTYCTRSLSAGKSSTISQQPVVFPTLHGRPLGMRDNWWAYLLPLFDRRRGACGVVGFWDVALTGIRGELRLGVRADSKILRIVALLHEAPSSQEIRRLSEKSLVHNWPGRLKVWSSKAILPSSRTWAAIIFFFAFKNQSLSLLYQSRLNNFLPVHHTFLGYYVLIFCRSK